MKRSTFYLGAGIVAALVATTLLGLEGHQLGVLGFACWANFNFGRWAEITRSP